MRFYPIFRDPAAYFAVLFLALAFQGVVWLIGRNSLELDWWRTMPFALLLSFAAPVAGLMGFTAAAVAGCLLVSALVVWELARLLYEPQRSQRLAMAAVFPVLGMAAMPVGQLLRQAIFG